MKSPANNILRLFVYCGLFLGVFSTMSCATKKVNPNAVQSYRWLEKVHSKKALAWVKGQDAKTWAVLAHDPRYPKMLKEVTALLTNKNRIPFIDMYNNTYRNFWEGKKHVWGIWRWTTDREYRKKHIVWRTLLDLDAYNKATHKHWVFEGSNCLPPSYNDCLVSLSNGGNDKFVVREFNIAKASFVKNGFFIPAAKTTVNWVNQNTLLVSTDWGPGSLTTSGYPREVRVWKRGEPLNKAKIIFQGKTSDVDSSGWTSFHPKSKMEFVERDITFYRAIDYVLTPKGKLEKIPFPESANFEGDFHGFLLASIRHTWDLNHKKIKAGSVVTLPITDMNRRDSAKYIKILYTPDNRSAFEHLAANRSSLYLTILHDVRGQVYQVQRIGNRWVWHRLPFPDNGMPHIYDTTPFSNRALAYYQSFTVPTSLYLIRGRSLTKLKSRPPEYNARGVVVHQYWATSRDGTKVPYFVIEKADTKYNGKNPTLLYGYGGFGISETPFYLGSIGKIWIDHGGVYVLANIRGGGEFGPAWHDAAIRQHRMKAFQDFAAITRNLFQRKITSPDHLAIEGGSNGGLLVGVAFTRHPSYYKAVVCESALLDMMRYTKMPPGASWIGEYGNPANPKMAKIIMSYSPYQNVRPGVHYPKVFFYTSTNDDRVQPGHSRKMVARMEQYHDSVLLYENTEGGHGAAANIKEEAKQLALKYTFLYQELMN